MTEPLHPLPIMGSDMEPVLISFHAPVHDLDLVAQHVVRDGLPAHLRDWQRQSGAREIVYLATCQRVLWMVWEGEAGAIDPGPGVRRYEGEEAWAHLLAMSAGRTRRARFHPVDRLGRGSVTAPATASASASSAWAAKASGTTSTPSGANRPRFPAFCDVNVRPPRHRPPGHHGVPQGPGAAPPSRSPLPHVRLAPHPRPPQRRCGHDLHARPLALPMSITAIHAGKDIDLRKAHVRHPPGPRPRRYRQAPRHRLPDQHRTARIAVYHRLAEVTRNQLIGKLQRIVVTLPQTPEAPATTGHSPCRRASTGILARPRPLEALPPRPRPLQLPLCLRHGRGHPRPGRHPVRHRQSGAIDSEHTGPIEVEGTEPPASPPASTTPSTPTI